MDILREGSSGPEVADVQQRLMHMGLYSGNIDSVYGHETITAVMHFQQSVGIPPHGVVDEQTYSALCNYSAQHQDPNAQYAQYQDPNAQYAQYQDPNAQYAQYQDQNAQYAQYQDQNAQYAQYQDPNAQYVQYQDQNAQYVQYQDPNAGQGNQTAQYANSNQTDSQQQSVNNSQSNMANDDTFNRALSFVLKAEGGYVDDPDDPGGATNKGITQHVFSHYLASQGQATVSVRDITDAQVAAIYKQEYWDAAHCNSLPAGLAIAQFDTAVNMGVHRAVTFLQESLSIPVDGHYSSNIDNAVHSCDVSQTLNSYLDARVAYYHRLAHGREEKFLHGWLNRVNNLKAFIGNQS